MTNFFRQLSRKKLYRQWVEQEGLSPEDLPEDLKKDERDPIETNDDSVYEINPDRELQPRMGRQINGIFNSIDRERAHAY